MALVEMDFALGGGTREVQNIIVSLTGNTWVDTGIKSNDAYLISLEVVSMYATFAKDTSDNWNVIFGGYFAIQVNASGNIEIKMTTYSGSANIYYV